MSDKELLSTLAELDSIENKLNKDDKRLPLDIAHISEQLESANNHLKSLKESVTSKKAN